MQNQENENRMGYSRILKFRAWDKISKSMHEVGALNFSDETVGFEVRLAAKGTFGYSERFTNVILMQYTGLKDRHGKEIYEGDIVESVLFDCVVIGNKKVPASKIIIGNIYENPELLSDDPHKS